MAWQLYRESPHQSGWLIASWTLAALCVLAGAWLLRPQDPPPLAVSEARLAETLAFANFDASAALPGWTIEVGPTRTDGAVAFTYPHERRIEVFVNPDWDRPTLTRVVAHELGHAVDVTHGNPERREQWLALRSASDADWWPADAGADFASGAGDFAEAFAYALTKNRDFLGELGEAPSDEEIAFVLGWTG